MSKIFQVAQRMKPHLVKQVYQNYFFGKIIVPIIIPKRPHEMTSSIQIKNISTGFEKNIKCYKIRHNL